MANLGIFWYAPATFPSRIDKIGPFAVSLVKQLRVLLDGTARRGRRCKILKC
jgi:hypothetical protein